MLCCHSSASFGVKKRGGKTEGMAMHDAGDGSGAQAIIAICAVLISLFSLAVSVCALKIQRRHDRKSVQPIPQIILNDYENCISVEIENAGIGPLILNEIRVENTLSKIMRPSVIEQLLPLPEGFFWTTFVEKIEERAIPAQKRLVLLELNEPEPPKAGFDTVRRDVRTSLGHLVVTVFGSDIYGSKLPPKVRSLDWFHRLLSGTNTVPKKQ
jgi:hypothetical protein